MEYQLDPIEDAIADIKAGKVVIVVDDEDRENEGDFVAAAEMVSTEMVNFMATHGRGLICTPITEKRCHELQLDMMVGRNTDPMGTAFTVSIDLKGHGVTTGISALDRAKTIKALVQDDTKPEDFNKPGHIFPLKAKNGGVLRRTGHTEAVIDLARLAGLAPAGVIVEIMNEDGSMARLPQLYEIAKKHNLKLVSIEDLIAYRMANESLIEKQEETTFLQEGKEFKVHTYTQTTTGDKHIAITLGNWSEDEAILARVHTSKLTGNIFDSCSVKTGPQLHAALRQIEEAGKGVIVFMSQHAPKPNEYGHDKDDSDTIDAKLAKVKMDPRDYGVGAQILRDLGVKKMKIMSNRPKKRTGIVGYGLEIVEYVPLELSQDS